MTRPGAGLLCATQARGRGDPASNCCTRRWTVTAILALVLAALVAPLPAQAQQEGRKVPRIGLIRSGSPPDRFVEAFLQGLRDLGYAEGRTIAIEYRWAEGKPERVPELTEELVRLKVDVLVTTGLAGGLAAKRVTSHGCS